LKTSTPSIVTGPAAVTVVVPLMIVSDSRAPVPAEDRDGFVDCQVFGVDPCIHRDGVTVGSFGDRSLDRLPIRH
jgi:hypothetical protein